MKVKRKLLLSTLDKVMPVISSRSNPALQVLNFFNGKVQASNGHILIETNLPEGLIDLSLKVNAEFLYVLLKKATSTEVDLVVSDGRLKVIAGKTEAEYAAEDPKEAIAERLQNIIQIEDMADLIQGLEYCSHGVYKDETAGPISGIKIADNVLWACDKYRILNWNLKGKTGLNCIVWPLLAKILGKFKTEITGVGFDNDTIMFVMKDDTVILSTCISGDYQDLQNLFPADNKAEVLKLSKEFPEILDRMNAFLKDVSTEDKEITFRIEGSSGTVIAQKFGNGGFVERDLVEDISLETPSEKVIEFSVNPLYLKDAVLSSREFSSFKEEGLILFVAENFKYLIKSRG